MGISINEISVLEAVLNEKFSKERLRFKMSVHFVKDRMNDPRNTPAITITELQGIFNRLTTVYLSQLMRLEHNDSFNVRCTKSDINIPCAISKTKDSTGKDNRDVIAITVMRKANFVSKDPIEFKV
ncbi:hypothetical protein ACSV5M_08510 [Cellvibrio sp. ARAG 10.3]|uniref:hypothetical protein n=1 Tax=Cellvibrio sp. ARAG 10.3 TaxID=3451358 RepID=UPI003F448FB8